MLVLGVEGDYSLSTQSATGSVVNCSALFRAAGCGTGNVDRTYNERLKWSSTGRGRIGVAFGGLMIYGTGGGAYGKLDTDIALTSSIGVGRAFPTTATVSTSQTHVGWAAGGGIETALIGNLTFKAEYLHLDFGNMTTNLSLLGYNLSTTNHIATDSVRGGFNFRF
jgi:outer membrane immunogenic protein